MQTLSKILDSIFHISNKSETQSVPKGLKIMTDTATNHVKNHVQDTGDLSLLPPDQKKYFLQDNSNLVKLKYYTKLNKILKLMD